MRLTLRHTGSDALPDSGSDIQWNRKRFSRLFRPERTKKIVFDSQSRTPTQDPRQSTGNHNASFRMLQAPSCLTEISFDLTGQPGPRVPRLANRTAHETSEQRSNAPDGEVVGTRGDDVAVERRALQQREPRVTPQGHVTCRQKRHFVQKDEPLVPKMSLLALCQASTGHGQQTTVVCGFTQQDWRPSLSTRHNGKRWADHFSNTFVSPRTWDATFSTPHPLTCNEAATTHAQLTLRRLIAYVCPVSSPTCCRGLRRSQTRSAQSTDPVTSMF